MAGKYSSRTLSSSITHVFTRRRHRTNGAIIRSIKQNLYESLREVARQRPRGNGAQGLAAFNAKVSKYEKTGGYQKGPKPWRKSAMRHVKLPLTQASMAERMAPPSLFSRSPSPWAQSAVTRSGPSGIGSGLCVVATAPNDSVWLK